MVQESPGKSTGQIEQVSVYSVWAFRLCWYPSEATKVQACKSVFPIDQMIHAFGSSCCDESSLVVELGLQAGSEVWESEQNCSE
jgi:hypothetical protein